MFFIPPALPEVTIGLRALSLHISQFFQHLPEELDLLLPEFPGLFRPQVSGAGGEIVILDEFLVDRGVEGILDCIVEIFEPVRRGAFFNRPRPH